MGRIESVASVATIIEETMREFEACVNSLHSRYGTPPS